MQPFPSCVVGPEAHRPLKPECAHPVLLLTDMPGGIEPCFQGKPGAVKQGALSRAAVRPAFGTFPNTSGKRPRRLITAFLADKSCFLPPEAPKKSHACLLAVKRGVKFATVRRIGFFHRSSKSAQLLNLCQVHTQ